MYYVYAHDVRMLYGVNVYILLSVFINRNEKNFTLTINRRVVVDIRYNTKITHTRDVTAAIFLERVVFRRPSSIFLSWSLNIYLSALAPDCRI